MPCFAVTAYRVKVVDQNGRVSYLTLPAPGPTSFNLRNGNFVPLIARAPNATYTVSVQIELNGAWQTPLGQDLYGAACVIRTSPSFSRQIESDDTTDFKATAYPNPYTDNFNLDISSQSDHALEIKIYDMMGRLIESHQVPATATEAMEFGKNLCFRNL